MSEGNLAAFSDIGSFGWALRRLRHGGRVTRSGWNGKGMYIELQVPDENSKMSRPYLFMKTVNDELVPWVASQSDLLADDWELFADGTLPLPEFEVIGRPRRVGGILMAEVKETCNG